MKTRFLLTILITLSLGGSFTVMAQSWKPFYNEIPKHIDYNSFNGEWPGITSTYSDSSGNFYIAYPVKQNLFTEKSKFIIQKWNGLFWSSYPELDLMGEDWNDTFYVLFMPRIRAMCVFRDTLYIGGSFDSVSGIPNSSGILKFDGQKWVECNGGLREFHTAVLDMKVFNNKILIGGSFVDPIQNRKTGLVYWNGSNYESFLPYFGDSVVLQLLPKDTLLYIYCNTLNNETVNIFKWQNNQLTDLSYPYTTTLKLALYNNVLHSIQFWPNEILELSGTVWVEYSLPFIFGPFLPFDLTEYDNKLWFCASRYLQNNYFGYFDGSIIDTINRDSFPSPIHHFAHYGSSLIAYGLVEKFNDVSYTYIAQQGNSFGLVQGSIVIDTNNNCISDSSDMGISDMLIELSPNGSYFKSDVNGRFLLSLDSGIYYIIPSNSFDKRFKYIRLKNCSPDSIEVKVLSKSVVIKNSDFLYETIPGINDLDVSISSISAWRAIQGFPETYYLTVQNIGTKDIDSVSVYLKHDSRLTFELSSVTYTSYSNSVIRWDLGKLKMLEDKSIRLVFKINKSIKLGDSVYFYTVVEPLADDTDQVNNYDTLYQEVVASRDPNEKQSNPSGKILENTKKIDYQVNFQNTGTDTAYRVVVVDTIDIKSLPLTKLIIKTSSHPYKLDIQSNVLIWTFDNILLPDSSTDEPGSHGFIRYTAGISPRLAVGDTILNRAYIYFDYQEPVITNFALCRIVDSLVSVKYKEIHIKSLKVYPNPANNYITIDLSNIDKVTECRIIDLNGKLVRLIRTPKSEKININLSGIHDGIYLVILVGRDDTYQAKIQVLNENE